MVVGSTRKETRVELCAHCHPFYTGKQKIVDTARRVDRFEQRVAKHADTAAARGTRRVKKAKDKQQRATRQLKMDEGG